MMAIRIFRAIVGAFTFRDAEIAELECAQKIDRAGCEAIEPPELECRGSLLWVRQKAIDRGDLRRNRTTP